MGYYDSIKAKNKDRFRMSLVLTVTSLSLYNINTYANNCPRVTGKTDNKRAVNRGCSLGSGAYRGRGHLQVAI